MSAKAIREATGKQLLNRFLSSANICKFAVVNEEDNIEDVFTRNPWIKQEVSTIS